ncbi:single-stranded DNA-binding protein [Virgibacillus proomii]|nr:single-stranded DNA-binding protein [Virgibacillus proomii]
MGRQVAENVASYCGKGSLISVVGGLQTRRYEKDGQSVYVTEVVANWIQNRLDWLYNRENQQIQK